MRLQHVFLFLLIVTFSFSGVAQDSAQYELYLNENNEPIDIGTYYKKCKARVLSCESKRIDSIKVNIIKQRFYFGKLDSIKHIQFLALLKSRMRLNINPSKIIIISHRNNLNGFDATKNSRFVYVRADTNSIRRVQFTKQRYLSRQQRFDSDQKKCKKGLKKQGVFPIYMFKQNNGYDYTPKHYNWTQSSINIPSIFKFNVREKDSSSVIFLRPNGDYFISREVMPLTFIKDILKESSWEKSKEDLSNSIQYNSPKGIGIFRNIWSNNFKSLRYTVVRDGQRSTNQINKARSLNRQGRYPITITTCFK